jgi:hypothetical protein
VRDDDRRPRGCRREERVIVDRAVPESCSVAAVDELTDEQADELKQRSETTRTRR